MVVERSIQEQALEAVVYLPVGFMLAARDEVPKLTAKGRAYVTSQITMAKTVGNFAVTFGSREAEKQLLRAVRRLGSLWGERPIGSRVTSRGVPGGMATSADGGGESATGSNTVSERSEPVSPNGSASHLAIVGYDSLSASQVVQRLAGLEPGELEAVRDYEAKTRSRATILNRAAQLLAGGGG